MLARLPGGEIARTAMSAAMLFAQPWRVPTEFFTEQQAAARRPGQLEASTALARALFDTNGQRDVVLDQLPHVSLPTLVIWGANDYVLPASQAHNAVRRLPNTRLALLTACGHLPHVEQPAQFVAALSSWLDEQDENDQRTKRSSTGVNH
jgi:2-hydroxy-6-oxonona-2,4-dienedioate hydrolase